MDPVFLTPFDGPSRDGYPFDGAVDALSFAAPGTGDDPRVAELEADLEALRRENSELVAELREVRAEQASARLHAAAHEAAAAAAISEARAARTRGEQALRRAHEAGARVASERDRLGAQLAALRADLAMGCAAATSPPTRTPGRPRVSDAVQAELRAAVDHHQALQQRLEAVEAELLQRERALRALRARERDQASQLTERAKQVDELNDLLAVQQRQAAQLRRTLASLSLTPAPTGADDD